MGSQQIRSFISGLHKDDRALYLSTDGFIKDALYEAERSTIPMTLWTLDDFVRAFIENYEQVDIETKLLVPLKKTFLPESCFKSHIGFLLIWLYADLLYLFL
jgi:restriction system protein